MSSSNVNRKFTYKKKGRNGMVLLSFNKPNDFNKNDHPSSLSQVDWNRKFDVNKLKNNWKVRVETDFQSNEQKFPLNILKPEVIEAKQFVKDLLENDVLEIKKRRWNFSSQFDPKAKKDHKKNLYDINNGLVSYSSTPKRNKVRKTNIASATITDRERWNCKGTFDKEEKEILSKSIKEKSKINSDMFWKENKKTSKTIGNAYIKPHRLYCKDQMILSKIKEANEVQREQLEKQVRFDNPGALKFPEKINALVYKEMRDVYTEQFNKFKAKRYETEANELSKKEINDNQLSNRIQAIKEWKEKNQNKYNLCITEGNIQEYFIPLVNKEKKIREEEKRIISDNHREKRLEEKKMTMIAKNNDINRTIVTEANYNHKSRYPINEYIFEDLKKNVNFFSETFDKRPQTAIVSISHRDQKPNVSDTFMPAYKKVSQEAVKEYNNKKEVFDEKYSEKYQHTGAYRTFSNDDGREYHAWSCCMKEEYYAMGCQRSVDKKYKWNFY